MIIEIHNNTLAYNQKLNKLLENIQSIQSKPEIMNPTNEKNKEKYQNLIKSLMKEYTTANNSKNKIEDTTLILNENYNLLNKITNEIDSIQKTLKKIMQSVKKPSVNTLHKKLPLLPTIDEVDEQTTDEQIINELNKIEEITKLGGKRKTKTYLTKRKLIKSKSNNKKKTKRNT
jgi:hypothetical protein